MLNSSLYKQLETCFKGGVKIRNEGIPARLNYKKNLEGDTVIDEASSSWGEYYSVCCAKCGDTRHRLWVNHLWGTTPPGSKYKLRFNVICFNESCDWGDLKDYLREYYFNKENFNNIQQVVTDDSAPVEVPHPGVIIPITDLPKDHQAIKYLENRKFDIHNLQNFWNLQYCIESKVGAQDRLVIPIMEKGAMIGWQARYIDQYGSGTPAVKSIPKYFTAPGMKTKQTLYGLEYAQNYPFVIITEGPFDVMRIGPPAVGLFGKTLSDKQKSLIWSTWRNGTVFVMLDMDAAKDQKNLIEQLGDSFEGGVHSVKLPDDRNPADSTFDIIWRTLSFIKPDII